MTADTVAHDVAKVRQHLTAGSAFTGFDSKFVKLVVGIETHRREGKRKFDAR